MKSSYTLSYVFVLLTLVTLPFLPNAFAQGALSEPSVRLVYFLPNDRPNRPERITSFQELIKDAQQFFADEMEEHGFGRKTFRVETDNRGTPVVHRIDGKFNENYYYTGNSDFKIWEEIYEHFDDLEHIYYIAADVSYELLNDGTACGLGGIGFIAKGGNSLLFARKFSIRHRHETSGEEALGGSAIIPASGPCFFDDVYTQNHPLRVTTHELGHAFGTEHDSELRQGHDYQTVMGGSGHGLSKVNAEWLSVSPFFTTNPVANNAPGSIQMLSAPTYSSEGIRLRFEVADPDKLHQTQLLVPENIDGSSWGAYRLYDYKSLNGKTSTVEFISDALILDPVDRIAVQIVDIHGSITWATFLIDIAALVPPSKVVSIPDRNLEAAIRETLGLGRNDRITDRQMLKLRHLSADEKQIKNLTGLESATNLMDLNLGKNPGIKSYAPLVQLPQLRELSLWANDINDLSALPSLPQLEFLDLNWNAISDVSPLAGFTNLKELWLQGNKLANTSTLFQLHNGIFPADEKVEVIEEQDRKNRTYMLFVFRSLGLKVRINPDVVIFQSANSAQKVQTPSAGVEHLSPRSVVLVAASQRPPMYWIDADGGTLHRLINDKVENLVPNVQNATSLAVDMTGRKLYWAEKTGKHRGRIRRANLDGSNVQLIKDLTSVPLDIALDPVAGKLYLINSWGKIQRLNVDGSNFQSNLITGLNAPKDLVVDSTGNKIYWAEQTSKRSGRIRRANLDGSNVQLVKALTSVPLGIALDPSRHKIYVTNAYGKVQKLNTNGSDFQPNLITGLDTLKDVAVDVAHSKLYWTEKGSIRRTDLNGADIQEVITGLGSPGIIVLGTSSMTPVERKIPAELVTYASTDVNRDKQVNKTDLLLVVTALGETPPTNPNFDVNADGAVNIADVLLVIEELDDPITAAAPTNAWRLETSLDPSMLEAQLNILRAENDGSARYEQAIAFLQGLLASVRPTDTQLLANYPNPFNPETWIPYQLAKTGDVKITIHDTRGMAVRQLVLGHQIPGFYTSRSRAAYWDGRNTLGERVASGIYFYQLETDEMSSMRKMVILK